MCSSSPSPAGTSPPWPTVLAGLGRVGGNYAFDPVTARHFPYASHAQVLRDHPRFAWQAVVDPSPRAQQAARRDWGVELVAGHPRELPSAFSPQVAVLATPPEARRELVEAWPSLRAVVVEKPLGRDRQEARDFLALCRRRGIRVQVNLWRRADSAMQRLALGGLERLVGAPRAGFGVYGAGLRNNGIHLVDLVRMLLGEVRGARVLGPPLPGEEGPLPGDASPPFVLYLRRGVLVVCQPLPFAAYREVGLDIWGERGRLSILNEGLSLLFHPRVPHRALSGARELAHDAPQTLETTAGMALYHLYDDLARALESGRDLCSPGESALASEELVDALAAQTARGEGGAGE